MYVKEKVQPNKANAPVLFIGIGGRGSDIIKGVAERCINDDTSNLRFVVMDTDANDLLRVSKGPKIIEVQTSSTSSVGDYLNNDKEAKNGWFPENKMLESKAVSEGAGQVRAISRLALNATITQGKIQKLYKAIDDLFLKDGGGLKQAIRVVIASTAAGGTGSGIAMETGMLVRHYVKKNYPEAAVMIRGFLVMPGVLDTVIKTQSEKDSLRCNGYATIKEINAFMMKGSGFCDTVPELQRYKDLHILIPNTSNGDEKLSNLPFDFCFLLDRTDSNEGNMTTLNQYVEYAAQSIYEQNIGPMRQKAASMEDNVLKLCISPDKLGRCRFGGTGAAVLRYPYEDIRDYIALNWTRASLIGSSADEKLTEKERKALLANSWLQFDAKYDEEIKDWEESPNRSSKNEPTRANVYMNSMEAGKTSSGGNDFTSTLWLKYITPKIDAMPEESVMFGGDDSGEDAGIAMSGARNVKSLAARYIRSMMDEVVRNRLASEFPDMQTYIEVAARSVEGKKGYGAKYKQIKQLENISKSDIIPEIAKNFTKEVFNSKSPVEKDDLGEYMLERYLSHNGKAIHPNAARYLLYALAEVLEDSIETAKRGTDLESYNNEIVDILDGPKEGKGRNTDAFQVTNIGSIGQEKNLNSMCKACDKTGAEAAGVRCDELLTAYFERVREFYESVIKYEVCYAALPSVKRLISAYEKFYATFENKVPDIERKKEDIVTKLSFRNGDCVRYLLGKKEHLDRITKIAGRPNESGTEAATLYAKIFESIRNNSYIEARENVNPFAYEAKQDVFDDIIIGYYKDRVDESCNIINVRGILQAIKLEYDVKCAIELDEINEDAREKKAAELYCEDSLHKYILNTINTCNNLASPGIKKSDNDEPREVSAIACNEGLKDGEGLRVSDFLPEAIKTGTVSKYELRFFRSVYNIMPTQLAKLSAPIYDDETDEFSIGGENEYERLSAGDYFRIYQKYMDKIGPDCKKTAIITPHVDMRWNAIATMPELDLDFQKRLMRKIHKAMIYGFIYDRIHLSSTLDDHSDEKNYQYRDEQEQLTDLVVSNKTKCDVLYEVLDALYNDRLTVSIIREYVNKLRNKSENAGFQSYEQLEFFKKLSELSYKRFSSDKELRALKDKVSLFTIVLMYSNSLPAQNKDMAEMKVMVESIIEMIYSEMNICMSNRDALYAKVSEVLIEQFNLLLKNYKDQEKQLRKGKFSDRVVDSIQGTLRSYIIKRDLEHYLAKMETFDAD